MWPSGPRTGCSPYSRRIDLGELTPRPHLFDPATGKVRAQESGLGSGMTRCAADTRPVSGPAAPAPARRVARRRPAQLVPGGDRHLERPRAAGCGDGPEHISGRHARSAHRQCGCDVVLHDEPSPCHGFTWVGGSRVLRPRSPASSPVRHVRRECGSRRLAYVAARWWSRSAGLLRHPPGELRTRRGGARARVSRRQQRNRPSSGNRHRSRRSTRGSRARRERSGTADRPPAGCR